jgi:hypothetical protein
MLFWLTPSQDMLFLQQSELLWDVHTLRPQELGLPFQESPVQKAVLHASVIFQNYPDQFLLEFSWLKKKVCSVYLHW